jgi:ribosomal protein S18 acetylase RimI-like enzyme
VEAERVLIKVADMEDATQILDLQKIAFQSEAALWDDYTIPPLTQTLEKLQADLRRQVFLKASVEGRIVGSVRGYVQEGTCFIGRLIVHPDYENRGIGTQLMHEIERHFAQARRYEIFTGEKSERNIRLYQKLGYQIFRTQRLTDKVTLVYMEKENIAAPGSSPE